MLRFQNDYSEGAHPNVLRALCDTNLCVTAGYGLCLLYTSDAADE
mgnify:CR=1 FL=1